MASEFDIDAALGAARILVVDDMAANIELLTETLSRGGFGSIDSATDPVRGLEMTGAAGYDLVLLDMRMPGMDGLEFLRRLRQTFDRNQLPVIVITGQTDDDTKRKALAAGVHDFITKPFVLWEMAHRVRNTLEQHMLHRRMRELDTEIDRLEAELANVRSRLGARPLADKSAD